LETNLDTNKILNDYDYELMLAKDKAIMKIIDQISLFFNSAYNIIDKSDENIHAIYYRNKSLTLFVKAEGDKKYVFDDLMIDSKTFKCIEVYEKHKDEKSTIFNFLFNKDHIIIQDAYNILIIDCKLKSVIDSTFDDHKIKKILYMLVSIILNYRKEYDENTKLIVLNNFKK
jgi:hypothetical protein